MTDISLHYTAYGAGEPLLLLHGNGESSAYFDGQIEAFSARYRVLTVDTRGHGQTPRGTAPFTYAQFAEDLAAFFDDRQLARASILGFSDGAIVALLFAMQHPTRVHRLILNGANLNPSGLDDAVQKEIADGYRACVAAEAAGNAAAHAQRELLGLMLFEPQIDPAALKAVTAPTLVLVGSHDMIRAEHSACIANALPNATLVTLDGDHFLAQKHPRAYNRAVLSFLDSKYE